MIRETPDWEREGLRPVAAGEMAPGWGRTLRNFTAGVRADVTAPTDHEPSLARMAVLVDDEAAAAFTFASSTSGRLRDLHDHGARRRALLGEDLWEAAPERHAAGWPDHPRSGFDRTGLDPEPVPGVEEPLGSR